tara:strand:+ start:498 stop:965 length:468 start_codon:yes stop_codon:yes gene_type:complete
MTERPSLTAKQCDALDCVVSWPGIASGGIALELGTQTSAARRLVVILSGLGLVRAGANPVCALSAPDLPSYLQRVLDEVIDRHERDEPATVEAIAEVIGRSRAHAANCLSRLRLSGHIGPACGVYPTARGARVAMAYRSVSVAFSGRLESLDALH